MGQRVEDVEINLHAEGRPPVIVGWTCFLHNGDNAYTSPTLSQPGSSWATVKSAAAQSPSAFAAAMTSIAASWWNAIPVGHVNSLGQPLDYREAMRLWIVAI